MNGIFTILRILSNNTSPDLRNRVLSVCPNLKDPGVVETVGCGDRDAQGGNGAERFDLMDATTLVIARHFFERRPFAVHLSFDGVVADGFGLGSPPFHSLGVGV